MISCARVESEPSYYVDPNNDFSLSYPSGWSLWNDTEPGEHLTLRSVEDHIMVFVTSRILENDLLPESVDALEAWGRVLYVRDDPNVHVKSISSTTLFMPCVLVRLTFSPSEGKEAQSETYTFTRSYIDSSQTRIWKLFAIMDEGQMSADERAGWELIKTSFRASNFDNME